MSEESAFDVGAEVALFVGVEAVEGFELDAESWGGGVAFVVVEGEGVDGSGQGSGEGAEGVE